MTWRCPSPRPAAARRKRAEIALLLALGCGAVAAEEGRIPIWEPTTITQPGRYVVTRNIGDGSSSAPPRAITVAANDVDIDLNGFTLRAGEPVISAQNVSGLTIHDGKIAGYEDAIGLVNVNRFALLRIQIFSPEDPAVVVSGTDGVVEGLQIDHSNGGIVAAGSAITIRRNGIRGGFGSGIRLQGCVACRVEENNLVGGLSLTADANSSGSVISGNVLSGAGILVDGARNQIEGNLISDSPGFGLQLSATSTDNVYRGNTARGNGGTGCTSPPDFCDQGSGNTSHGDNYLPGLQ